MQEKNVWNIEAYRKTKRTLSLKRKEDLKVLLKLLVKRIKEMTFYIKFMEEEIKVIVDPNWINQLHLITKLEFENMKTSRRIFSIIK